MQDLPQNLKFTTGEGHPLKVRENNQDFMTILYQEISEALCSDKNR